MSCSPNYCDEHHGPMLLNEPHPGGDPFRNYNNDHTATDELATAIRELTRQQAFMFQQMEERRVSSRPEKINTSAEMGRYKWNQS
tara:strand:+ start:663 stop:917 length:255 start_codon:yes stop_codon:yes gene_type:complete